MSAAARSVSNVVAALAASQRYPIFPCNPENKRPYTEHGFHDASTDESTIIQWWGRWPEALIGYPTGNGIWVLDDDTAAKPDPASMAWLDLVRPFLNLTRRQTTRSGGTHYIFAANGRSSAGITVDGVKLRSVDSRGAGGYCIDWGAHGFPSVGEIVPLPPELSFLIAAPAPAALPAAGDDVKWNVNKLELPDVLPFFDPSDRDEWALVVGMALHHASGGSDEGFDLFHRFSAGEFRDGGAPAEYQGEADCLKTWHSFGKDATRRPVTLASVFKLARDRGYDRDLVRMVKPAPPRRPVPISPPVVPAGTPLAVPPPPDAMPAVVPAPRVAVLRRNRQMQVEATLEALVYVLGEQTQARIGFDEFRGRVMFAPAGTEAWRPLSDTDMIQLRETLAREQDFAPIGKELMRDALQLVAARHCFDSAIVWLNGLTWDGVPRVEQFLTRYCGTVDDEYTREVSLYIWTGLTGRVLDPGCQLDMVVALQSRQGKKKSTGLQAMVPLDDCFTDGLSLHEDGDDFKRLIRGKLVIEVAEMAGLSKGDINVVKRAITRRVEEWIEKFQTHPTRFNRRCMLFASTNEQQFLPPDETGQRRWLPVEIVNLDRERIAADRDQLWAEGAHLWRNGVGEDRIRWREAERLAAGRHAQYEQTDVWESTIETWLNTPEAQPYGEAVKPPPKARPLTLSEVLAGAIKLSAGQQDARAEKRAGRVMRQLGFEVRRVRSPDGKSQSRYWVRRDL